jgi:hypothetical protein
MRVQLELPELTEFPNGFPAHWMNIIFTKNRPDTYQIHAITTTYVRLVEAAMEDYRQARLRVHAVWIHRDPSSIPIGRIGFLLAMQSTTPHPTKAKTQAGGVGAPWNLYVTLIILRSLVAGRAFQAARGDARSPFEKSSKNSETGSTPETSR